MFNEEPTAEEYAALVEEASRDPIVRSAKIFRLGLTQDLLYLYCKPIRPGSAACRIFLCTRMLDPLTGESLEILLGELRAPEKLESFLESITDDDFHESFSVQPSAAVN